MDEIEAAYGRLGDALDPPGDAVALVAKRVAVRRRRRTLATVVASASTVAVIAASGFALQSGEPAPAPAPEPASPELLAPTDLPTPSGPPQVAERHEPTVDEDALTCDGAAQLVVVTNPQDYAGEPYGPETVRPWLIDSEAYETFRRFDEDQIVATLKTQKGDVYAELGLVAIDGTWRVESIAGCTSAFPGLAAVVQAQLTPPVPRQIVALPAAGASGVMLSTLGRSWTLASECGQPPEGLLGVGQVSPSGDELDFVDLSGGELTFVPAGSTGAASCDAKPPSGPTAQLDVDCAGAGWRYGTVANPAVHSLGFIDYREPEDAVQPWLEGSSAFDLRSIDAHNAVASLVAPNDAIYASLGLTEIGGFWRVNSLSACTDDFPGLEAAEVFGSGLPLVGLVAVELGHCWIETLEYQGSSWEVRDEDQFGWGGGTPQGFLGVGAMRASKGGRELTYTDLSGPSVTLLLADAPGTEINQNGCD